MSSYPGIAVYVSLIFFTAASAAYLAGAKTRRSIRAAFAFSVLGLFGNLLALSLQTLAVGRLPLASGFEFLLIFVFVSVLVNLVYENRSPENASGGVVMLIAALLTLSAAALMPDHQSPGYLVPALKSPWLTVHVLTAAAAYGGFTLAAGLAFVQLKHQNQDDPVPRVVGLSFAFLSLSILLGAIWAEQAWGSYWSWDPKETWALITWIVYATYLHLHFQKEWRGRPANLIVIAGFVFVLFTFFGVNYLMSGLHSYALTALAMTPA